MLTEERLLVNGVLTPEWLNVHLEEELELGKPSKAVGLCMPASGCVHCWIVLRLSSVFLS